MMNVTRPVVSLCLAMGIAVPVEGQLTELQPGDSPAVSFELAKPFFEGDDEFGFLSTVLRVAVLAPVGERANLIGDLGLATASAFGVRSNTLSNLEVGVLLTNQEGMPQARFTVGLPTSAEFGDDDFATFVGFMADTDRQDRYAEDLVSVNALFTPTRELESGRLGFRLGASGWIPDGGDVELIGRYGVHIVQSTGTAQFGAELVGQAILSEGDLGFSERTNHQVTFLVGLRRDGLTPDLFVRVPLDEDLNDLVDVVVGVRVSF